MVIVTDASEISSRYILHETLGEGGMGIVYRATDRLTGRELALKRVLQNVSDLDLNSYDAIDFRLAMAREFKLSASLRHPNIIRVLDYGFDAEKQPFYTMEFLPDAINLVEAGAKLSVEKRVDLLIQTLNALAYLHRRGILHRDLKPANILVTENRVKVLDFGLSVMHELTQGESGGTTAGTLAYIAPELLLSDEAGIPADLYAVGLMGYEMFAGEHPYNLGNVSSLVQEIMYTTPDVDQLDIPVEITHVIEKLLNKDPEQRYQSADAAASAFNRAIGHRPMADDALRESYLQAARLIGRDNEVKQLSDALSQATQGNGSAWLIAGENGVGKTRLLDEVRQLGMVQGATALYGETLNIGNQPFQVWLMALRWLCLLEDNLSDDEIALLKLFVDDIDTLLRQSTAHIEPRNIGAEALKQWVVAVLERVLRKQNQPVVLLLEDLHQAGSESIHVLKQLSALVAEMPLLIIGSYSHEEAPELEAQLPDMRVMTLPRLSDAAIADLSAAMLGEAGRSYQVLDLLQRETDGNIYFMIEVIRALAESVGNLADIGRMTLPQNVFAGGMRSVIERRLSRLSSNSMTMLNHAALMGRQLDVELLEYILPKLDIQHFLMECANAAVLEVHEDKWYFSNEKLRESVAGNIDAAIRHGMHERIAEAMETLYGENPAYLPMLAYHYRKADNDEREEHFVTLAGVRSLKRGGYEEAITYFKRAQVLVNRFRLDARSIAYRQLNLSLQIAEAYTGTGAYSVAQDWYQQSLSTAMALHDTSYIARIHTHLGEIALVLNHPDIAHKQYEMGLELYESIKDVSGVARALSGLGNVAYERGNNDEATKFYQRSLDISRELGESRGMAGAVRQTQTMKTIETRPFSYEETQELYATALEVYENASDDAGMGDALYNLGIAAFEAGIHGDASTYLNRSLHHLEMAQKTEQLIQVYNLLGCIATRNKEYPQATTMFIQALRVPHESNAATLEVLLNFAKLHMQQESFTPALVTLAFLVHHDQTPEPVQDNAETLIFDIETKISSGAEAWEKGKNSSYESLINYLTQDA